MSKLPQRLISLLDNNNIRYDKIHHRRDYTAQETAADTHTPGREFAKTVILWVDGDYVMAVLPAHHSIDFDQLRKALGATQIDLATEGEIGELCSDCEVGSMPPFGSLYDMPVYISATLAEEEEVTFNAGTHNHVIRMRYSDYERLAQPKLIEFSRLEERV